MTTAATSLARDIASRLHHRASLICSINSNVVGDLRDVAQIDFSGQRESFATRKTEILAYYGYSTPTAQDKPFAYQDGMAIIPIHGMLINRFSGSYSFVTGYNFIRSQMQAALADSDVKMIVFDVNTSGGVASGCSELALEIFQARSQKPSLSVVDARCYSAGYFLASSAGRMISTPSGGIGSIGVLAMHLDYSDALAENGIKLTFIIAGDRKVDGNSYQRLSARAKASIQKDVDYHYELFVQAVARNRDISEEEVRATEAGCYLPPEALELNLIDEVLPPAEAITKFYNDCTEAEQSDTDIGKRRKTSYGKEGIEAMDEAQMNATIAQQVQAGIAAATAAERARQSGIRNCDEAKDRTKLAAHLADNTAMSVDDAKGILGAAAKEVVEQSGGNGFAAAMAGTPNPNVGADAAKDTVSAGTPSAEDQAAKLLADFSGMTGRKVIEMKRPAA